MYAPSFPNNTLAMQTREHEQIEQATFGDIFAASVVGFYTVAAFVISGWSGILLLSGNTGSGGPVGLLVQVLKSSGIL
ncbi:MAG: hypothetical protein Kow0089_07430 [Desulfobulbaceae bacterium]